MAVVRWKGGSSTNQMASASYLSTLDMVETKITSSLLKTVQMHVDFWDQKKNLQVA